MRTARAPPRWVLYAPRPAILAAGFGLLEAQPAALLYRLTFENHLPRGRPHHLRFRVSGLPAAAVVEPTFPPGTRVSPGAATATSREWDLDVPAGSDPARAAVVVHLTPPGGEMTLPSASLAVGGPPVPPGPPPALGLVGSAAASYRLARAVAATPDQEDAFRKAWPAEATRLKTHNGSLWRPATPTARIRLVSSVAKPEVKPSLPASPSIVPPQPEQGAVTAARPLPSGMSGPTAMWWGLVLAGVAVLAARYPRTTWLEQLALLASLPTALLGGNEWYVLFLLLFARLGWLMRRCAQAARTSLPAAG